MTLIFVTHCLTGRLFVLCMHVICGISLTKTLLLTVDELNKIIKSDNLYFITGITILYTLYMNNPHQKQRNI